MKDYKKCTNCSIEKPIEQFHIARQGKTKPVYKGKCKVCYREEQRIQYHNLSEEERQERRRNNKANTFEYRQTYKLKYKYGLTREKYFGMILEQKNKCKICMCNMETPQIDHNHDTGEVRALLCRSCNTTLGLVNENPDTLYNMINYINDYLPKNSLA